MNIYHISYIKNDSNLNAVVIANSQDDALDAINIVDDEDASQISVITIGKTGLRYDTPYILASESL